jgi:hypothetical protein
MTRQSATGKRIRTGYPQLGQIAGVREDCPDLTVAPALPPAVAKESRVPAFLRDLPHWEPTRP